jgi:hypothetical protein
MDLPQITLTETTLPKWVSEHDPWLGIYTIKDASGNALLAVNNPETATLIMSLPRILAFFANNFRLTHPCRIDVDRVLSQANIKLQRQGESTNAAKPEPMAD